MVRPKVYICRRIPDEALAIIAGSCEFRMWDDNLPVPREVLCREISEVAGLYTLLTDVIDDELLERAAELKIISNMAVGFDNIDVSAASKRGIMVTNTPGVLTETTADLAFALLLATARRVVEAAVFLAENRWQTWDPFLLTGRDVYGATLGLIGLGRIGKAVARRARGFNMRVLYYSRHRDMEAERELGVVYVALDVLLSESDFVSLHVPLTKATRNLIGERELSLMKKTAILINTSRGSVVDEGALFRALKEKKIWGAGLDVFAQEPVPMDNPLLKLDNVVALPHIGSASFDTRMKMARMAAENLVAGVTGKRPPNLLNPEVWADRNAGSNTD